ncbi:hypothetical protein BDV33DRAFT_197349 [Aspergillus novoparasiticus]|uniref:Uncharacterized protein n=1 Tax=Aspergillus novoparasiticus TaxID=986946 RepID=A0A5N6F8Z0_9EURO|nr:hypothetical protein BDV33DRAFT_197349 [Aspergillus novoparasiticus]
MSSSTTLRKVPEGWTTEPFYVSYFVEGPWAKIAKRCGLQNPEAIMCTTPESGEHYGLISDRGRYYFTDDLAWSLREILKPVTLDGIVKKILDDKEYTIKAKALRAVETAEDRQEREEKIREDIALMEQKRAAPDYLEWKRMDSD